MVYGAKLRGLTLAAGLAAMAGFVETAAAETALERGAYLMRSVVACGNCHTPKGPKGELPGMELAGMSNLDVRAFWTTHAPNITQDKETGIGAWSDAQIIAAIREGKRPDGTIIGPPMPIGLYRNLSDRDVRAIVAYLRQVKPVKNAIPKSEYKIPLPPAYGPPVITVAEPPKSDKLAYGAYLAGPAAHCIECHSPMSKKGPDIENQLGAGGLQFKGPWGVSVSANITPTGLGKYSDAELKAMITTGKRANGTHLKPPMPYPYYAHMRDEDLEAIIAYLRSLPAKQGLQ
ncbi:MAG: cytochrome C [Hyphomicrobiales bacterium]|nr:MAG: cytochrome C [Hyphomicrobiales bacterium]